MLIPLHKIKFAYQQILKDALECDGLGCTIYILVSNDVDSLTSFKILSVSFLILFFLVFVFCRICSNQMRSSLCAYLSFQTTTSRTS